jgi:hypothetical protein
MEWTRIEDKWNEMVLRLQSGKREISPRKSKQLRAEGPSEPTSTEPSSLTGTTSSGLDSAALTRESV